MVVRVECGILSAMAGGILGYFYWRRIRRWCLLGTIGMVLWLLYPVATCSFGAFKETPLSDYETSDQPGQADKSRVKAGETFVGSWFDKTKICYARTPLTGQEDWKTELLLGLAIATVVATLLDKLTAHPLRGND